MGSGLPAASARLRLFRRAMFFLRTAHRRFQVLANELPIFGHCFFDGAVDDARADLGDAWLWQDFQNGTSATEKIEGFLGHSEGMLSPISAAFHSKFNGFCIIGRPQQLLSSTAF